LNPIPFELPSATVPLVVMQGELNGRAASVVLDTGYGAPFTVLISPAQAAAASVSPGEAPAEAGIAVGAGAVTVRSATVKSFQLGDVRLIDCDAGITGALDHVGQALGRPVDAMIGWSFLRSRVIRIDYPARQVDLAAAPGPRRSAIAFAVSPKRPLITVQVELNGRGPFTFAVDTGASASVISPEAAKRAGMTSSAGSVTLKGAGGAAGPATLGSASILTLGGVAREALRPVVVEFLPRISEAAGAPLDGIVGADVLSRGRLTIDFPRSMLWLDDQKAPIPRSLEAAAILG
jgi:predicted aspartyl protease